MTVRKILDTIQGRKAEDSREDCSPFIGFERATSGEFKGLCCRGFLRSKENCCAFNNISLENRCCTGEEVLINNKCVKFPRKLPKLPFPKPSTSEPPTPEPFSSQPLPIPPSIQILFQKDKPSVGTDNPSGLENNIVKGGKNAFDDLVLQLQVNPLLQVQLIGSASPEGPQDYNQTLGARRANLIAEALVDEGISITRIASPSRNDFLAGCQEIRNGVITCGELGASGPENRRVLAKFFQ